MKHFNLDGTAVPFEDGDTLMDAATRAGHFIPRLCWHPTLGQSGACRLCTVKVDGHLAAACTTRAAPDQVVENRTPELDGKRLLLTQMLFVEGNHFCPQL
jgi:[NiFe] hydrogenase diaphorase moiety small subunit